jgi:DedD protein
VLGLAGTNAPFALTDGRDLPESEDAVLLQRRARRRLVGAIALVVFVVIVLPIVFDKEPRPITQDLVIEIPSQDSGKFSPRVLPPGAPATQGPEAPAEGIPEAAAPQVAKAAAAETPKAAPELTKTAPEADAAKTDTRVPAESGAESFMVPLGAYSNPVNAKQVQSRVAAAGYRSYSESLKGAKGAQLRVRAGPFATRDAAERAREKLKSLGLNPVGAVAVREQP